MSAINRFPSSQGPMAERVRSFPWHDTPLGPMERWPTALTITVDAMLASRFPQCLFWGPDLIAIYNDGYLPILGTKTDALGQPLRVTWSETWDALKPIADKAMSGEAVYYEDLPVRTTRHGPEETAYFTFCYSPVFDDRSNILGMMDIVTETTEAVRARQVIASEADRYRQMFDNAPGFMAMLSGPDHVFKYANPAYQRLVGNRELFGKPLREALPETVSQGFVTLLDEIRKTGKPHNAFGASYLLENPSHGVEERYLDFVYQPIMGDSGAVANIFVSGSDVTDRTLAEKSLRQSEARLRFLDDLGRETGRSRDADAILAITTRMVGEYLSLSNCAYADLDDDEDGFTIRGDWAAEGSPSIVGHYSLAAFGELAVRNLSRGLPLVINDNLEELAPEEARTFQDIGIAATICMPLIREGKLTALMAIHQKVPHIWSEEEKALIREVTERSWAHIQRVRTEAELRQTALALTELNSTLEARVEERTSALVQAEEALRQSQKMEAVGQLTGGLAHDFNNILAGISGSLELMSNRIGQGRHSEIDRYMSGAQAAVKRAAALTQRLLAFSRRQTLDPKPSSINTILAGMEELILRSIGPAIELQRATNDDLWTTFVDVSQLENALLNLCINARDAMPDGGRLTIATLNQALDHRTAMQIGLSEGDYVRLSVADTGTGMPPDVIARAFDPFYTTKPIGQGTGLGLSMVYGFAGQSGGSARIESEMGRGTTIAIYLPRHAGAWKDDDRVIEATSMPPARNGEKILVVDDEPLVRMVAVEILVELGYEVLEAGDGPSALRSLQQDRDVDLLVTDVGLPGGMNGRQLADAARTTRPGLKVLFVTGYAESAVLNHGDLDRGMAIVTKPFSSDIFARRVKGMIDQDP